MESFLFLDVIGKRDIAGCLWILLSGSVAMWSREN